MNLVNHTAYESTYSMGIRPKGKNCLVIIVKATYDFADSPELEPELSQKQQEIYDVDAYIAEPGQSSTLYENDYSSYKPKCDVVIHAVAHAPSGKAVDQFMVSAQISSMNKSFVVVGERHWKGSITLSPSSPEPFTTLKLDWEKAYGGTDNDYHDDPEKTESFSQNPIGRGYWKKAKGKLVKGTALAQTEELAKTINSASKQYQPQGFGPIGRNWHPRIQLAGTYDKKWEQTQKPFLPDDFDEHYYQCAPQDQQIPYLKGGEKVELIHLTPQKKKSFIIPVLDVPINVSFKNGKTESPETVIDTLTIDTEKQQFTLVARTQVDFIHSMLEITGIKVGEEQQQPASDTEQQQEVENV